MVQSLFAFACLTDAATITLVGPQFIDDLPDGSQVWWLAGGTSLVAALVAFAASILAGAWRPRR